MTEYSSLFRNTRECTAKKLQEDFGVCGRALARLLYDSCKAVFRQAVKETRFPIVTKPWGSCRVEKGLNLAVGGRREGVEERLAEIAQWLQSGFAIR